MGALSIYCRAKGYLEPQYDVQEVQDRKGLHWCCVVISITTREGGERRKKHMASAIGRDPQEAKNNAAMKLLIELAPKNV